MAKLLYDIITLHNPSANPIYDVNSGIIIDKFSGELHYQLKQPSPKYFYFTLEFSNYQYSQIYQPDLQTHQNKITGKIYHIYLNIRISAIKLKFGNVLAKLAYHFAQIQIRELQKRKDYRIKNQKLEYFIDYRETNPLYLIPWQTIRINNKYVFDLKKKRFLVAKEVPKMKFSKKGGIIETNDAKKIVSYFKDCKTTLVILPANMTNLWKNSLILTYDKLLSMSKAQLASYRKHTINRIIIHECHSQFLVYLKTFLANISCDKIWIINSLPLRYYFSEGKTPKKLTINNLSNLNSLWLGATIIDKKKYKTEIIRFLLSKFNQLYIVAEYEVKCQDSIKLPLNKIEQTIHASFQKYYDNWLNKLTNDPDNIYSMASLEKTSKVAAKIYGSAIRLMLSVRSSEAIPKFFQKQNKKSLDKIKRLDKRFENFIKIYQDDSFIASKPKIRHFIAHLQEKKNKIGQMLSNYQRYSLGNVYNDLQDNSCPVCYSNDEFVKSQLICGHTICLECIMNVLARTNSCPVCAEFINITKMAVVKETIADYSSELVDYFNSLNDKTVILADFAICLPNIIDITQDDVSDKIKKLGTVDNVVIFSSSSKLSKEMINIIGFFQLFNNAPRIASLEIY